MNVEFGYVYVMECRGYFKIGHSTDPRRRLRKLRTGSPIPIRLVHTLETALYREIEQQLHARFHKQRRSGEWFVLSPEDIEYIKGVDSIGVDVETRERNEHHRKSMTTEEMQASIDRISEAVAKYDAFRRDKVGTPIGT